MSCSGVGKRLLLALALALALEVVEAEIVAGTLHGTLHGGLPLAPVALRLPIREGGVLGGLVLERALPERALRLALQAVFVNLGDAIVATVGLALALAAVAHAALAGRNGVRATLPSARHRGVGQAVLPGDGLGELGEEVVDPGLGLLGRLPLGTVLCDHPDGRHEEVHLFVALLERVGVLEAQGEVGQITLHHVAAERLVEAGEGGDVHLVLAGERVAALLEHAVDDFRKRVEGGEVRRSVLAESGQVLVDLGLEELLLLLRQIRLRRVDDRLGGAPVAVLLLPLHAGGEVVVLDLHVALPRCLRHELVAVGADRESLELLQIDQLDRATAELLREEIEPGDVHLVRGILVLALVLRILVAGGAAHLRLHRLFRRRNDHGGGLGSGLGNGLGNGLESGLGSGHGTLLVCACAQFSVNRSPFSVFANCVPRKSFSLKNAIR